MLFTPGAYLYLASLKYLNSPTSYGLLLIPVNISIYITYLILPTSINVTYFTIGMLLLTFGLIFLIGIEYIKEKDLILSENGNVRNDTDSKDDGWWCFGKNIESRNLLYSSSNPHYPPDMEEVNTRSLFFTSSDDLPPIVSESRSGLNIQPTPTNISDTVTDDANVFKYMGMCFVGGCLSALFYILTALGYEGDNGIKLGVVIALLSSIGYFLSLPLAFFFLGYINPLGVAEYAIQDFNSIVRKFDSLVFWEVCTTIWLGVLLGASQICFYYGATGGVIPLPVAFTISLLNMPIAVLLSVIVFQEFSELKHGKITFLVLLSLALSVYTGGEYMLLENAFSS